MGGGADSSGRTGCSDLNEDRPANQREYNFQLLRCAEVQRILRVFSEMSQEHNMAPPQPALNFQSSFASQGPTSVEELEGIVKKHEQYLSTLSSNASELIASKWRCIENIAALELSAPYFGQGGGGGTAMDSGLLGTGVEMSGFETASGSLTNIVGVIADDKIATFERIVFRATRGNIVTKFSEMEQLVFDSAEGREVKKSVFVGFLQGAHTYDKVKRICDVVGAHVYNYDEGGVRAELDQLRATLKDLNQTVSSSEGEIRNTLGEINSSFCAWDDVAKQETGIYATLNRFKYPGAEGSGEFVVAEGWVPSTSMEEIKQTLDRACAASNVGHLGATMQKSPPPHSHAVPPTYFVVNKYTVAFQAIVEAYGVARYREHNPTVYTVITFPFLFAVMFGDAGHGLLLLLLALYFIVNEKELGSGPINEMIQTAFDGRYVVFLMGLFAIYCGLLYNEVFGMPLNLYGGTRWHYPEGESMAGGWKECYKGATEFVPSDTNPVVVFDDPTLQAGCNLPPMEPYPIGMDPIWKFSSGGLIYFNSLKMKMSVVFGVTQMVFGIILKATNDVKHRRPLDVWCEFIPQMIFMNGIFGYMCILILIKWSTCWTPVTHYIPGGELVFNQPPLPDGNFYYPKGGDGGYPKPRCDPVENVNVLVSGESWIGYSHPPDIKQILINMVMGYGQDRPDDFVLFGGMNGFHMVLVPIAVLMIPIMLFPKPFILKSRAAAGTLEHDPADPHAGGDFEFGEVFIHQVIETIEFVLGAISNTASYLRLWALSLAHSQLTDVFFEKCLGMAIANVRTADMAGLTGGLVMYIGFAVWLSATFGVLMVMESLSAVLHALRLHWVEFQNKYYKGDGVKFVPFSFTEQAEEE